MRRSVGRVVRNSHGDPFFHVTDEQSRRDKASTMDRLRGVHIFELCTRTCICGNVRETDGHHNGAKSMTHIDFPFAK